MEKIKVEKYDFFKKFFNHSFRLPKYLKILKNVIPDGYIKNFSIFAK